jgi:uroporphyrinogen-III synthase/uncharacterized protein YoxC
MNNMRNKLIIVRPVDRVEQTRIALAELSYEPVFVESLTYHTVAYDNFDLIGVQAVVATSVRALQMLVERSDELLELPLYIVGQAGADAARDLGFLKIPGIARDADDLISMLRTWVESSDGKLLYVRGDDVAVDLAAELRPGGYDVRELVTYRSGPVVGLPENIKEIITSQQVAGVLLFSRASTQQFTKLLEIAGLTDAVRSIPVLCLSPAVLDFARNLPWVQTYTATTPDLAAMIDLVRQLPKEKGISAPDPIIAAPEVIVESAEGIAEIIPEPVTPEQIINVEPKVEIKPAAEIRKEPAKIMTSVIDPNAHIPNADLIIERFGGIRPMATKVKVPVTTVQGWKKRNVIPANRADQIKDAAQELSLELGNLIQVVSGSAPVAPPRAAVVPAPANESRVELSPHVDDSGDKWVEGDGQPLAADESVSTPQKSASAVAPAVKYNRRKSDRTGKVVNSVWIAVMILAIAVIVGLMAMGPGVNRIVTQDKRLNALETELQQIDSQMKSVQSQNSLLAGLVPEDLRAQIDAMRTRAAAIESAVTEVGTQAKNLADGVLGSHAGTLQDRLNVVEGKVKAFADLSGSAPLSAFVMRMQQLQASSDGQKLLRGITDTLNQTLAAVPSLENDAAIQKQLATATKSDPATAEALKGLTGNDLKAATSLLALTQMRSALLRDHASFDKDLKTMRDLVARDNPQLQASIDRLAPKAKEGVLTPMGLTREFRAMTGDVVAASLAGDDVSITEKAQARLHDIMKIERAGEPLTGTDTQKAIDMAQKKLDQHDVPGAIAVLQSLDGPAAEKAAPWVEKAETTLLAQQVQDSLTKTVSAQISLQPLMQQYGNLQAAGINIQALTQGVVQSLSNAPLPGGTYVHDPESGFRMMTPPQPMTPSPLPALKSQ